MLNSLPRVLVGIVTSGEPDAYFTASLTDCYLGHGKYFHADTRWAIGHITDDGRNEIAEVAIKQNYDYLVFLDDDMIFPPGIILSLLKRSMDTGMYSGAIYNTRSDHRVNLYNWSAIEDMFNKIIPDMDKGGTCDAGGTGAMCIPVKFFKDIRYPYFEYKYTTTMKKGRVRWSEDIDFCKKMLDAGHRMSYIPIVCGHIIKVVVRQTDPFNYAIEALNGDRY